MLHKYEKSQQQQLKPPAPMTRPKSSTSASQNHPIPVQEHQLSFRPSKEVISSEERQGLEDCIATLKRQLNEKDQ
jgi:hypothetical protein